MTPRKIRKSILKDFKCHIIETKDVKNGCNKCRLDGYEFKLCSPIPKLRGRILETPENIRKQHEVVGIQSNIAKLLLDLGWLEKREEIEECITEINTLVKERDKFWRSMERE
jgi:hypothetical protein